MDCVQPPPRADHHPAAVYLARLAPGSRRAMAQALEVIAALLAPGVGVAALPWHQLGYQHTQAVRSELARRYAPATANRMLSALRGVLREAWRLGLMPVEAQARAGDLAPVRGRRLPKGRALTADELGALFGACGACAKGARDRALLALLCGAGLRRAELVALDLVHLELDGDGAALRVLGKGNKERHVPLPPTVGPALSAWLAVRGDGPGPLLRPVDRRGRVQARRLTPDAVLVILRNVARRADVAAFAPHDLRRTYVSALLDGGADLATVQQLAGHASPTTTARYDRRGEDAKRRAAGRLRVPG